MLATIMEHLGKAGIMGMNVRITISGKAGVLGMHVVVGRGNVIT